MGICLLNHLSGRWAFVFWIVSGRQASVFWIISGRQASVLCINSLGGRHLSSESSLQEVWHLSSESSLQEVWHLSSESSLQEAWHLSSESVNKITVLPEQKKNHVLWFSLYWNSHAFSWPCIHIGNQWVLSVAATTCTYLSVGVSCAYEHGSPHHRASYTDLSALCGCWHPVAMLEDTVSGFGCLQWDSNQMIQRAVLDEPLSEQDSGHRYLALTKSKMK